MTNAGSFCRGTLKLFLRKLGFRAKSKYKWHIFAASRHRILSHSGDHDGDGDADGDRDEEGNDDE